VRNEVLVWVSLIAICFVSIALGRTLYYKGVGFLWAVLIAITALVLLYHILIKLFDLLEPAWRSNNEGKALKVVEKETKQRKLAEIAKNAYNQRVRCAAIEKVVDQSMFADLAKNAEHWDVIYAAIQKLTDHSVLTDIAKNNKNSNVRQVAVKKLTNQTVLAGIAKCDSDGEVRSAAVEKLTDQSALAYIAMNDSQCSVREKAVKQLTNQSVLADIAKKDDFYVSRTAMQKLTNQSVLEEIATDVSVASGLRIFAAQQITDRDKSVAYQVKIKNELTEKCKHSFHHSYAYDVCECKICGLLKPHAWVWVIFDKEEQCQVCKRKRRVVSESEQEAANRARDAAYLRLDGI